MVKPDKPSLYSLWIATLSGLAIALPLITTASAHTIKTEGDVAVTFHIDPDHNPKAAESATAWFAMTRRGGKPIPLQTCHCKLAVYLDSELEDLTQTMSTSLKPISVDYGQNLPAAELIFPKSGVYRLEFSGTPKQQGDFNSFRMTYSVTVLPGQPLSPQVSPQPSQKNATSSKWQDSNQRIILTAILSLVGSIAVIGAIAALVYRQRHKHQPISSAMNLLPKTDVEARK